MTGADTGPDGRSMKSGGRGMVKKYDVCGGFMLFRCLGDRRMTGRHFRVLGVIATHDRLSTIKRGQGCWAGQKRIADFVGIGKSHVSEVISDLANWDGLFWLSDARGSV